MEIFSIRIGFTVIYKDNRDVYTWRKIKQATENFGFCLWGPIWYNKICIVWRWRGQIWRSACVDKRWRHPRFLPSFFPTQLQLSKLAMQNNWGQRQWLLYWETRSYFWRYSIHHFCAPCSVRSFVTHDFPALALLCQRCTDQAKYCLKKQII